MRWLKVLLLIVLLAAALTFSGRPNKVPVGRTEVLFWHFWGGQERVVVDEVVRRFNEGQEVHFVRAVAMPGNNLDLKLFLAITGGDPPDLVNQDDPIIGDWAWRGAILPLEDFVSTEERSRLKPWLFPAAWQLAAYGGKAYGLCNGLDVRALIYNQSMLREHNLPPPTTIAELDQLAEQITPACTQNPQRMGFFPNPRNLWVWGVVFGGDFYDEAHERVTLTDGRIVQALDWMASYGRRYGDVAVSFRARDQSLPGQVFPLIAGRYAAIVDGQWRVNDIEAAQVAERNAGTKVTEYGVSGLPVPKNGGRRKAGWINGNFFIVPRGSSNPAGAWEFMKFWSGFRGHAAAAAETARAGGWIPVSPEVIDHPIFQDYLADQPLFTEFIKLAASPNQVPRPNIPGAQRLDRGLRAAAEAAMFDPQHTSARSLLENLNERINRQMRLMGTSPTGGW